MSGTEVVIGLKIPLISGGASGFMSHRSICEGPPSMKNRMHRLARFLKEPADVTGIAFASSCRSPGRLSPRNPSPP